MDLAVGGIVAIGKSSFSEVIRMKSAEVNPTELKVRNRRVSRDDSFKELDCGREQRDER